MTSLWLRDTPPTPVTVPPPAVDVAIVGGGIAGIATALHLARRGVAVAVLEAGEVAGRASGRNDGQLLLGLGEHYNRIHGQFGASDARRLWSFLDENHTAMLAELAASGIDCALSHEGGLRLAETPHEWRELETAATLLQAEDIPHELLTPAALRMRLPAGLGFHGGLFLPGEAIVDPAAMVRGLAAAASRAGAKICPHAPVHGIDGQAGDFRLRLATGAVTAQAVVLCTAALAPELDPTGLVARTVFRFRGQIVASDPLPADVLAGFPSYAMSSNFCYEYFRIHDRRFVLGGKRWSVPGEEVGIADDSTHNPTITRNLLAYAHEHFPTLRGIGFPTVWTGIMAGTPDGLPLCGALPGRAGTFALLGFNGYGLSFAFLAGRTLAELLVDGHATHPAAAMFAPRRFANG